MTTSHRVGEGAHNSSLGIFDAPEPWGPWTTVYYDDHWAGKDRVYHHKFPTKFMSADGRTMWLLYSGLGAKNYGFVLRRAVLELRPGGHKLLLTPQPGLGSLSLFFPTGAPLSACGRAENC